MAARASAATCRPTKIVLPCPARADCVSGPGGGSVSAGREDQLAEALDSARIAHQVACPEARRRVLDHVPQGAPDLAELTGEQRRVVQRWQAAEAEYDRLRRCAYVQAERKPDAEQDQLGRDEGGVPTPRAR